MTTDRAALDAFATHFLDSYHETAVISRRFAADYGIPPTLLAKAHGDVGEIDLGETDEGAGE